MKQPVPKRKTQRLKHEKESRIKDGEKSASTKDTKRESADIKNRTRSQRKGRSPQEWYTLDEYQYLKRIKRPRVMMPKPEETTLERSSQPFWQLLKD